MTIHEIVPPSSLVFCLFCLENSAVVRISKKRLPFLDCPECKTRVFWNTARGVRGYFIWAPDAHAAIRKKQGLPPLEGERARYAELGQTYGDFTVRSLAAKAARTVATHADPDSEDDS